MSQRRGLSPLCAAAHQRTGKGVTKGRSADHLFRHRQRYAFVVNERDRCRGDRSGLANSAGSGLEGGWVRGGAREPGSGAAFCRLGGNKRKAERDSAAGRVCGGRGGGPVIFLIWGMGFCRRRRWRTSRRSRDSCRNTEIARSDG